MILYLNRMKWYTFKTKSYIFIHTELKMICILKQNKNTLSAIKWTEACSQLYLWPFLLSPVSPDDITHNDISDEHSVLIGRW